MEVDMFLEENNFCRMLGRLGDQSPAFQLVHPFLNVSKVHHLLYIHIAVLKCFYTVHLLKRGVPLTATATLATAAFIWNIYITNFYGHSNFLVLWYSVILYQMYQRDPSPCAAFFFLVMNVLTIGICEFVVDVFIVGSLPWLCALLPSFLGDFTRGGFYDRCYKFANAVVVLGLYWILTSSSTEGVLSVHVLTCVAYLFGVSVGMSPSAVLYFLSYVFAVYTRVHVSLVCKSILK